jgi:hypothetical protein
MPLSPISHARRPLLHLALELHLRRPLPSPGSPRCKATRRDLPTPPPPCRACLSGCGGSARTGRCRVFSRGIHPLHDSNHPGPRREYRGPGIRQPSGHFAQYRKTKGGAADLPLPNNRPSVDDKEYSFSARFTQATMRRRNNPTPTRPAPSIPSVAPASGTGVPRYTNTS